MSGTVGGSFDMRDEAKCFLMTFGASIFVFGAGFIWGSTGVGISLLVFGVVLILVGLLS